MWRTSPPRAGKIPFEVGRVALTGPRGNFPSSQSLVLLIPPTTPYPNEESSIKTGLSGVGGACLDPLPHPNYPLPHRGVWKGGTYVGACRESGGRGPGVPGRVGAQKGFLGKGGWASGPGRGHAGRRRVRMQARRRVRVKDARPDHAAGCRLRRGRNVVTRCAPTGCATTKYNEPCATRPRNPLRINGLRGWRPGRARRMAQAGQSLAHQWGFPERLWGGGGGARHGGGWGCRGGPSTESGEGRMHGSARRRRRRA